MNLLDVTAANPRDAPGDNRANNQPILDQDPTRPYFLNNPKHIPKGNPGVDNVEEVVRTPPS